MINLLADYSRTSCSRSRCRICIRVCSDVHLFPVVRTPIRDCAARYAKILSSVASRLISPIAASIAGIVCQYYGVLCPTLSRSPYYAYLYLAIIDFISISSVRHSSFHKAPTDTPRFSVALYGLIIFYGLTKDELKGRRPLAKFLAIKLIVFITFYQSFVVSYESNYDGIHPQKFS